MNLGLKMLINCSDVKLDTGFMFDKLIFVPSEFSLGWEILIFLQHILSIIELASDGVTSAAVQTFC